LRYGSERDGPISTIEPPSTPERDSVTKPAGLPKAQIKARFQKASAGFEIDVERVAAGLLVAGAGQVRHASRVNVVSIGSRRDRSQDQNSGFRGPQAPPSAQSVRPAEGDLKCGLRQPNQTTRIAVSERLARAACEGNQSRSLTRAGRVLTPWRASFTMCFDVASESPPGAGAFGSRRSCQPHQGRYASCDC
jgi:hypothetical protein